MSLIQTEMWVKVPWTDSQFLQIERAEFAAVPLRRLYVNDLYYDWWDF